MHQKWILGWLVTFISVGAQAVEPPPATQAAAQDLQVVAAKVHELESAPLSSESQKRRTDLFTWFVQSPDVNIKWCAGVLLDAPRKDKDTAGALLVQAVLSAGAYVIEHPENSADGLMVARAGLHGALLTYQATVAAEPKKARPYFDQLVALDTGGKLDDYLNPKMSDCK
jgi:hypothetical protein